MFLERESLSAASILAGLAIQLNVGQQSPQPRLRPCGGGAAFQLDRASELQADLFCAYPAHFLRLQGAVLAAWRNQTGGPTWLADLHLLQYWDRLSYHEPAPHVCVWLQPAAAQNASGVVAFLLCTTLAVAAVRLTLTYRRQLATHRSSGAIMNQQVSTIASPAQRERG